MTTRKAWMVLLGIGVVCVVLLLMSDIVALFQPQSESGGATESSATQSNGTAYATATGQRPISTRPGEVPPDFAPPEDLAQDLMDRAALRCSLVIPDPALRPDDPRATWIGKVIVGAPGEEWPQCDGVPMVGVCQLNVKEAPVRPDSLEGIELIAVFMAAGRGGAPIDIPTDAPNQRAKWAVRAYASVEGLVAYKNPPATPRGLNPCAARFETFLDHPGRYEELDQIRDQRGLSNDWMAQVQAEIDRIAQAEGRRRYGTKIGGWPAPVQEPIVEPLAFQIGSEAAVGLNWVKGGCVFVWRSRLDALDAWDMVIQSP